MSNFTFTSVDGATYEVQGPPTATFEQAKAVFAQQVSTGGLTGLPVGGLVNAVTQAAGGLSSALAQLGPNAISLTSQIGNYINLPNTIGLPIPNAITVSNFVNTNIASQTIGTIGSTQIQGLVAQTAASVNQATDVITNAKGLGQFGFNADQLQLSGLIKPGVAAQINLNPTQFTSILSSPTSWTGKLGATDLTSVLSSASLQTTVQQGLMSTNFDQLKQIGTITGLESAQQLGPLVNVATKFGAGSATEWLSTATGASGITSAITSGLGGNISGLISSSNISGLISGGAGSLLSGGAGSLLSGGGIGGALSGGIASVPGLTSIMNGFAASAQFADAFSFASSFLGGGGNPLEAGTVSPPPAVNTVNRQTVNQAVKAIIGNSKIPIPDFAPPGTVGTTSSGGLNSLISSATSTINSLTQSAGGAIFNV